MPNITLDPETGIGNWTDQQIITAIRSGERPDGSLIGPPMPIGLYNRMSDEDAQAIVAYLPSVPPVKNKVAKSEYPFPLRAAPDVSGVLAPPRSDKVRYGEYMASPLGHCIECHTPMIPGQGRDFANRLGAGGFTMSAPGGGEIVASNITPDRETGIGAWTDVEIKRAITQGERRDGGKLVPIMAFAHYHTIGAEDLDALVAYLRSIKPVRNQVR